MHVRHLEIYVLITENITENCGLTELQKCGFTCFLMLLMLNDIFQKVCFQECMSACMYKSR